MIGGGCRGRRREVCSSRFLGWFACFFFFYWTVNLTGCVVGF